MHTFTNANANYAGCSLPARKPVSLWYAGRAAGESRAEGSGVSL